MGKRAELCAKYLKLADEAVAVANVTLKQLDAAINTLDAKEDNAVIQQLMDDKQSFADKITGVAQSRKDLEDALGYRDIYKASKDKLKDNRWQVFKKSLAHPVLAVRTLNDLSKQRDGTAKGIDDALVQVEKDIAILSGSTKVLNLILAEILQQAPVNEQKTQADNAEKGSKDFTEDDINAFEKAVSFCGSKYADFQPSEPLNDCYQVQVDNVVLSQEFKQDNSNQEGITTGKDEENNSNNFRMQ